MMSMKIVRKQLVIVNCHPSEKYKIFQVYPGHNKRKTFAYNKRNMSLRILDLFSGIGGFSLALESIATTVAYCEIDENCQKVLKNNMKKGLIDSAPVFDDVRTLSKNEILKLKPNMITAGFPCTDISAANPNGRGIHGEHSGLFKEILRILDEFPFIDIVLLENSPRIMKKGYSYIHRAMKQRDFTVRYCIIEAKDVGALHRRQRWYCLCTKHSNDLPLIEEAKINFNWGKIWKIKKIHHLSSMSQKRQVIARCQMLGNSIVPQCAMYAWNILVNCKTRKANVLPYRLSKQPNIHLFDGDKHIRKPYFATPTFCIWHQYRSLTDRGSGVLSNQLYYNTETKVDGDKRTLSHEYISNPRFVETLMGYHIDWTFVG